MIRMILAIIVTFATLVISFILTNVAYMLWASWRYQNSSMAGIAGFFLGLWIAPYVH
jgi:hypothetical protein